MARDFRFSPNTLALPTIAHLKTLWVNIPDESVKYAIAVEHQYLTFHYFVLQNCRHVDSGKITTSTGLHLAWTIRSGAIKSAILMCGSIAEAALRAHAEKRQYNFNAGPANRTFGVILNTWKTSNGSPRADVQSIWHELIDLKNQRNNVHLFRAAFDPHAHYQQVTAAEGQKIADLKKVLLRLQQITSP